MLNLRFQGRLNKIRDVELVQGALPDPAAMFTFEKDMIAALQREIWNTPENATRVIVEAYFRMRSFVLRQ